MIRGHFDGASVRPPITPTAVSEPPADEVPEIECPLTGEQMPINDIDALAMSYSRITDHINRVDATRQRIRQVFAMQAAEQTTKTRRVLGRDAVVKLTMPDDSWDNGILKEAWNDFPDQRDRILRIERIAVQKREYAKVKDATGDDAMTALLGMVSDARRESTALPSVTIERLPPKPSDDREPATDPEVAEALELCDLVISMIDDLPTAGVEFGESVGDRVRGIAETIDHTGVVTANQRNALDNMRAGIERWLDRRR